jgi:hypothetical protein
MKRSTVVPLLAAIPLAIAGCGGAGSPTGSPVANRPSATLSQSELATLNLGVDTFDGDSSFDASTASFDAANEAATLKTLASQHLGTQLSTDLVSGSGAWNALSDAILYGTSSSLVNAEAQVQTIDATLGLASVSGTTSSSSTTASTTTSVLGSKAPDAFAKELAHSAQVAAETYGTNHNGSYAGLTPSILNSILNKYDATIQTGPGNGNAYIASNGVPTATKHAYVVIATASTGDRFSIARDANGSITRTCGPFGQGGCSPSGTW